MLQFVTANIQINVTICTNFAPANYTHNLWNVQLYIWILTHFLFRAKD